MKIFTPVFTMDSEDGDLSVLAVLLLFAGAILLSYLFACLTLYAFVRLTGMLEFSWMNGVWVLVLMMATMMCVKGGK